MTITNLILIALFVEAIVQQLKPLWDKTAGKITVAEIVSMSLGVLIAIVAKINFLAGVVEISQPLLQYVMYILTGVALGRGPSFVHDLWVKIKNGITSE